jgi:hypothetical protein
MQCTWSSSPKDQTLGDPEQLCGVETIMPRRKLTTMSFLDEINALIIQTKTVLEQLNSIRRKIDLRLELDETNWEDENENPLDL